MTPGTARSAAWAGLVVLLLLPARGVAQDEPPSHAHIRHVLEGFPGAPNGEGLLPLAEAEARTAQQHAGLAANDPTNIDPMKRHAAHVLHVLDPERAAEGPGLGFGVKAAVEGIIRHVGLAAEAEGASSNVRTHAAHVLSAARGVRQRVDRGVELAEQILTASDYLRASRIVGQLQALCEDLITGTDLSSDGTVSLEDGEGGLQQVRQHLALMADAEGLN